MMKLNYFMEISGFVLCLLLCFITCARYNLIDLKDRIYVKMVHVVTVILGMNILSFFIIHNNILPMKNASYIGIYLSFWLLVWIIYYLNLYFDESVSRKNHTPVSSYIIYGLPCFVNLIVLIINLVKHYVFDLTVVDSNMKVVFNTFCFAPYALAIISLVIYVVHLIRKHAEISERKQYIFYVLPILFLFAYYIQFRYKAVATFGFSCSLILLLLYLYSYNYNEKIDHLTNLPNEHSFNKMLDYRIGNGKPMFVAMLSLNEFKYVNREYGYENGNLFIKSIGDYLAEATPKNCLARLGGDQFGVIFDGASEDSVREWMEKIITRFEEPWHINKIEHKLSVSVTGVSYPEMAGSTNDIHDLLIFLNKQVKKKKQSQFIICNDEFKEKMNRKIKITSILKEVMNSGNMFVEYQPIYDSVNNAYTRGEALFRLKDPVLNDISPAEFFPIAEEHGYVIDIGYVLIDKVCQYIKSFIDSRDKAPVISVNFSRQQLMAENVGEKIMGILKKYDLKPEYIAVELPEEVFSVRYEHVKERIFEMHDMGFRFYLDGFGTGFLDVSHLMELPFDLIKINKSMIREAENNDTIYLLVSAMTAVFEENGKKILGDGIESEHLKEITDMLFMDYLQGYYFSAPISEEEARKFFLMTDVFDEKKQDDNFFDMKEESVQDILAALQVDEEEQTEG